MDWRSFSLTRSASNPVSPINSGRSKASDASTSAWLVKQLQDEKSLTLMPLKNDRPLYRKAGQSARSGPSIRVIVTNAARA